MKKGARVRKCETCGDKIFWLIPADKWLDGGTTQEIKPWCLRENKYWCRECYEKHIKGEG